LPLPAFHGTGQITGIAGSDRYSTAATVAAWGSDTQNKSTVGLTTGVGLADAVTGCLQRFEVARVWRLEVTLGQ
jgi:hypothetical protein